jgi:hypothetical protein
VGHAAVSNTTGLAGAPFLLLDEEARSICAVVVKGTYKILSTGACVRHEEQAELVVEPQAHGDPASSSLRLDSEIGHFKPGCDVVVLGHARAPAAGTREMLVGLRVGPLQKGILVVGERTWSRSTTAIEPTRPLAFETMPLVYERAFGGWDVDGEPATHSFEARNPVGVGFRTGKTWKPDLRLPNLEDPLQRLSGYGQKVAPAGCGFVAPHWQPRAGFAGTYDEAWTKQRMPRYPLDFDRRFHLAGSPGLSLLGYLRGDEPFVLSGVGPRGDLRGNLPGGPPPVVNVRRTRGPFEALVMNLDTVIFHADDEVVQLIWRGHTVLRRGPHELTEVQIGPPPPVVVDPDELPYYEEPEDDEE